MQAASLYLGVRILAGAAGEPCYMTSAERPSPGALSWTADSRWGVVGGVEQAIISSSAAVRAASPCIASRTPRMLNWQHFSIDHPVYGRYSTAVHIS